MATPIPTFSLTAACHWLVVHASALPFLHLTLLPLAHDQILWPRSESKLRSRRSTRRSRAAASLVALRRRGAPGGLPPLIHPSAWKVNSSKFAVASNALAISNMRHMADVPFPQTGLHSPSCSVIKGGVWDLVPSPHLTISRRRRVGEDGKAHHLPGLRPCVQVEVALRRASYDSLL